MNLSDNLKKIRKEHNLSQEQLAEKLNVSRQSVSKWESGQAYPEMDKMLQLCKLFNLNIDDLLNQDVKEVNRIKQSKSNLNKFIDDFLDYITKTVDMFSSMKLRDKIKCIFEQLLLILIIALILLIIGEIGLQIFRNLFSFLPSSIYYFIYRALKAVYFAGCVILEIILVFHIFKVRYLDYYIVVKESTNSMLEKDEPELEKKKEEPQKIFLEKKQEKIIIRDPEHSGYKFISGLLSCFLFMVKIIVGFIMFILCLTCICLIVCLVLSFLCFQSGMLFVGILLGLISLLIFNFMLLDVFYHFLFSKRTPKTRLTIGFMIALISLGLGIGFGMIGITQFDMVSYLDLGNYIEVENTIAMTDDLYFEDYYQDIEYIESSDENIKVVIKSSSLYEVDMKQYNQGYYFEYYLASENVFKSFRQIITDINDKKIIDYSQYKVYIYTTKENIQTLKNNLQKHYDNQEQTGRQTLINEYEERIENLNTKIEEQKDRIVELEELCDSLQIEECFS